MANILIVYYSSYGHIEAMAQAQAEGAARVPGARVSVKRVPELTPPEIAAAAGFRLDQAAPIAQPDELETLTSFHSTLLHHGMIIVGLPYSCEGITTMREVTGGSPYGATCVTGSGDESRMPSALELQMCRFQGEHVARIASRLAFSAAA